MNAIGPQITVQIFAARCAGRRIADIQPSLVIHVGTKDDHVRAGGQVDRRGQRRPAKLKADTMVTIAETEINATARNTYLWEAKKLREGETS